MSETREMMLSLQRVLKGASERSLDCLGNSYGANRRAIRRRRWIILDELSRANGGEGERRFAYCGRRRVATMCGRKFGWAEGARTGKF